ncbi:hypothetical protein [Hamadaea tsunoensis]|uniref:hypothetical protein n=1 Tax=Hamadaea tsunoensis TaxID=53368 RepID=UPI000410E8E7|nr:hypothetical protein [Hamadaea tsunoensis]
MGELRNLHDHLSRWAAGQRGAGDGPGVQVRLTGVLGSGEPIHLSRRAVEELARLLELDRIASTGSRRTRETSAVDELCIGALRLRALAHRGGVWREGPRHSRTASRGVASARRVIASLMRVVDRYAWDVATEHGADWPAHYLTEDPGPRAVEHLASADRQLAIVELRALDKRVRDASASHDATTMTDEMIFVNRDGVLSHVRIFAPAHRGRVVVIGELADGRGFAAGAQDDLMVDALTTVHPELSGDETAWFRYFPRRYAEFAASAAGRSPALGSEDEVVERLQPGRPSEAVTVEDLSAVINGPVRRWHAADYNVATLTAANVRTVDPFAESMFPRGPVWLVRCRSWTCRTAYEADPQGGVRCPRCGRDRPLLVSVQGSGGVR